jgi:hypothetical protein
MELVTEKGGGGLSALMIVPSLRRRAAKNKHSNYHILFAKTCDL